jgi:hypothetical protein
MAHAEEGVVFLTPNPQVWKMSGFHLIITIALENPTRFLNRQAVSQQDSGSVTGVGLVYDSTAREIGKGVQGLTGIVG